jgi:hypothetical protein
VTEFLLANIRDKFFERRKLFVAESAEGSRAKSLKDCFWDNLQELKHGKTIDIISGKTVKTLLGRNPLFPTMDRSRKCWEYCKSCWLTCHLWKKNILIANEAEILLKTISSV